MRNIMVLLSWSISLFLLYLVSPWLTTIPLLYGIFSLKILKANEVGAIFRLGKEHEVVGGGPHLVWLFWETISIFPTETVQKQFPGEPEEVQRDEHIPLKPGEVRAIRIYHPPADQALFYPEVIGPEHDEALKKSGGYPFIPFRALPKKRKIAILADSLHKRLTSEVSGTYAWRLLREDDPKEGQPPIPMRNRKIFQFVRNVNSKKLADQRLRDAVESVLQDVLAKMTHAEAVRMKNRVAELVQKALQDLVGEKKKSAETPGEGGLPQTADQQSGDTANHPDHGEPWGIEIEDVAVLQLYPGVTVNKQIAEAAASENALQVAVNENKAEADKIERLGTERAKAVEKMTGAMAKNPDALEARRLDVLEIGMKNANLVMAGEAMGLVAGAKKVLQNDNV